jgi:putative riboflavin transport system substrate-binding protein
MPVPRLTRSLVIALVASLVVGCQAGSSPSPSGGGQGSPTGSEPAGSIAPTALTVGLGYIPSVQFAPFYLAQENGYYAAAGLDVTFQNKIDPDLVTLVGQGALDIGVADGTSVIPAVSQGIPIKYIATIYGTFPNVVFAKTATGIATAADLAGRKIGIPGRYGSSWIMLQALLGSANLTPEDVTIVDYPNFTQGAAVQQDVVAAATGFANNEPVQLQYAKIPVTLLQVDGVVALPGPGLIAGTATLASKREAIKAFVAATLRAMNEIAADQGAGLRAAIATVPDLAKDQALQALILQATAKTWGSARGLAGGFGAIDTAGWQATIDYMTRLGGLVAKPVTVTDLVDGSFLPEPGS